MVSEGRNDLYEAAWLTLVPAAAIPVTTVAINLFGDLLRDTMDPTQQHIWEMHSAGQQILADDDGSSVAAGDRLPQGFVMRVGQHVRSGQRRDIRIPCDHSEFVRRRVTRPLRPVRLGFLRPASPGPHPGLLHVLMHEETRTLRMPHEILAGTPIAVEADRATTAVEAEPEGLFQGRVIDIERGNPDPVDLGCGAPAEFVRADVWHLASLRANLHAHPDVRLQHLENALDEFPRPFGLVVMQYPVVTTGPSRHHEVTEIDEVSRVQVGEKEMPDVDRRDAALDETVHDPGSAIHEKAMIPAGDQVDRPPAPGVGHGQPGAEQRCAHTVPDVRTRTQC